MGPVKSSQYPTGPAKEVKGEDSGNCMHVHPAPIMDPGMSG